MKARARFMLFHLLPKLIEPCDSCTYKKIKWKMRIEKSDYNVENGWLVAHGQTHVLRPKTNHLWFEIAFAQSTLPNELHVFRNLFSVQSAFII